MYKILIMTLLATLLNASYPIVYSALGNTIYENAQSVEKLKDIEAFSTYKEEILEYVKEVQNVKQEGFKIDASQESADKKAYLATLRKLSKQNDFFVRNAEARYKISIENENSLLFSQLINSGLIDTQKNKQEIIDYYFKNQEDINASGVIQFYLDEDARLKDKRDAHAAEYKSKKMREAEKIKRIRRNDIQAQQELEARLQKEVDMKKQEIRKNQKRELRE